ncbi:MAG: DUF475 domain-containing protein [Cyanobacteriota bacterium]|nr:DUF475 domain-containing protein [Cyanobacteriota bacterium]
MDITALPSLTDVFEGADQWGEVLALLPVLVMLELVLSADNAVALAAIARSGGPPDQERLALNIGIGLAMVLRVGLILLAQWVLQTPWVQLLAAAYLFWMVANHLTSSASSDGTDSDRSDPTGSARRSLIQTVVLLGFTDLAFSIDSVAAAVAVSDQILLISAGALIGIVALRFTSGLFIRWLDHYPRLETAGFLSVAFVGIRLVLHVVLPSLNQPDWLTLLVVMILFVWGFSVRSIEALDHAG